MSGFSIAGGGNALDCKFGASASSAAPTSYTLRLYTDDPDNGGVELSDVSVAADYPGYSSVNATNNGTNFPASDVDGSKTCLTQNCGPATGDWAAAPRFWAWCSGTTTTIHYSARISNTDIPLDTEDVNVTPVMFPDPNA